MTDERATGPTLDFEAVLAQFVERAEKLIASQARMRDLIRVNNDLTSKLDLPTVLHRIVEIGMELLNARYAAMGVIGDERRLEQFIHIGMDPDVVTQIDHLPEGKGLLGALIDDPHPVRLLKISDDGRSSGFPAHHPPMENFLGVPIRVRDEVYGNLYLTDSLNGAFSAEDEELAQALAATAGIAIENARLFDDSAYRERWSSALADTARRLMRDEEEEEHLGVIVEQVRKLAEADLVSIGRITQSGDEIFVDRASGIGADDLAAMSFPVAGTFAGDAIASGEPILVSESNEFAPHGFAQHALLGNSVVIPFAHGDVAAGVLTLSRSVGRPPFSARDLDMGSSFASHISVAIDRAESRRGRRRVELLEDRSRIARDLHDHVIQRLFGTGLSLQAAAAAADPETAARITAQITEIDNAIAQIRQSIFAMQRDPETTTVSLRARILEIVDRVSDQLTSRPRVTFLGPVDLMVSGDLTDDVAAVVTESLANAVRHAGTAQVAVTIAAVSGEISIEVVDDGVGPGSSPRLSGLSNLRQRAEARGGEFEIHEATGGGTRVSWIVPT
ncbi:GAF domain-containing protein [Aeromicrobium ginsengisoli]|uniref:GAF domain-containing protein n=1 Tax=Aeromicrobium ginsengisoli TaxID=363867 RepID=A0A5M4FB09_9ACTN|nr:GAF domain-containing protein [Aeromicrobium ginsengisoli]KAA1395548.1 GAF domain-containing protein [Aeromicrobium ginsengisoli]